MTFSPSPDSICLSLGLDGFEPDISPRAPRQTLRLMICPTFDPELCITFISSGGSVEVEAVSARACIGSQAGAELAETDAASGRFASLRLTDLGVAFRQALGSELDGMARDGAIIHVAWSDGRTRLKLEGANPAPKDPLGMFVGRLNQLAYEALPPGPCRTGIAGAARYFGISLP